MSALTADTWERARAEAEGEWGTPARIAAIAFAVPLVGAILLGASRLSLPVFQFFTREDGVLEWLQFAAYVTAAVVALIVAWTLLRSGRRSFAAVYLAVALGAFVVAGEEISWGQRVFGVETPESLEELNRQGEIGVHNIFGVETIFNLGLLAAGLYGSLCAWLIRTRAAGESPAITLLVPPLFLTSCFLLVFLHRLVRFTVPDVTDVTAFVKFGEWPELCFAAGLAAFCVLNLRGLRRQSAARRT